MLRSRWFLAALTFVVGVGLGGWLFAKSQPRSFLAVSKCEVCYKPSDLAGLLASAGIQRAGAALPLVVKETERCLAIEHPFKKRRVHLVIFPKKDIKSIGDVSLEDQPYLLDCIGLMRDLIVENGLVHYRVETNGPGLQHVTYLHFHLVSTDGRVPPGATEASPPAVHP